MFYPSILVCCCRLQQENFRIDVQRNSSTEVLNGRQGRVGTGYGYLKGAIPGKPEYVEGAIPGIPGYIGYWPCPTYPTHPGMLRGTRPDIPLYPGNPISTIPDILTYPNICRSHIFDTPDVPGY